MTDLVKSLKIGNNSYAIQDGNTLPALTAAQRTTLLSNGTYLGNSVENGVKFETDSGKFEQFSKVTTGITFTASAKRNDNTSMSYCNLLTYGNGKFFGVSPYDNTTQAVVSTDNGETWHSFTLPMGGSWANCFFVNGKFYLNARSHSVMYCSADLETWDQINKPSSDSYVTNTGSYLVFVKKSATTNGCAVSYDYGSTWTMGNLPNSITSDLNVTSDGNGNALAITPSYLFYSSDGLNWTRVSNPLGKFPRASYANGRYLITWSNSTTGYTSTDHGATWTAVTVPFVSGNGDISYACNNLFFATNNTTLYYSTDGETWSIAIQNSNSDFEYSASYSPDTGTYVFCRYNAYFDVATAATSYTYSLTPLSYTKSEVDAGFATAAQGAKADTALQNTATGTDSLTIDSATPTASDNSINIGKGSSTSSNNTVVIGKDASANASSCTVVGKSANANYDNCVAVGDWARSLSYRATTIGSAAYNTGHSAVLLGPKATNTEARTFKVSLNHTSTTATDESTGLYTVLDSSGNIPTGRMGNVYEIVQSLPASPTSGKIYFVTGS